MIEDQGGLDVILAGDAQSRWSFLFTELHLWTADTKRDKHAQSKENDHGCKHPSFRGFSPPGQRSARELIMHPASDSVQQTHV